MIALATLEGSGTLRVLPPFGGANTSLLPARILTWRSTLTQAAQEVDVLDGEAEDLALS